MDHLTGGDRIDYLVGDEAQFYTAGQVDQLARIVDELQIDVFAVGILTDFQTRLFPGSQRLVELCDRIEVLQVRSLCWCGNRATHNARTVNGVMVTEGDQVVVGDTSRPASCRRSSRTRCSAARTTGGRSPGPRPGRPGSNRCRSRWRRRWTMSSDVRDLSSRPSWPTCSTLASRPCSPTCGGR